MIYIFDKTQAIIKVLTNDDFTAAHLNFKINTATTFEFSLPTSKALPSGSKYVATPHPLNDSKFIMLRLTERVDNTETIDYSAYELAYQELATDGYIEDKRPQNQSALNLMKIALDGSNWELNNVNVSGTATTNFYYVDRLSAISKVVDLLGGEIVFYIEIQGNAISGRYMDYLARQGADTSKVFASGSNLLTVERQSDTSGIYTAILPRGKGEEIDNGDAETPDGYGRRINISDVEWKKSAGNPLDKPKGSIVLSDPDATAEWGQINGNARLLLKTYDDIDDVNVLINSAYKTLQSVNHPQIQYSATVADVGGLSLGDTVLIMHGDRDLSYKTRVFEVKYDLLSPDQTELSLGDDLSSNSITSQINSLNAVADTTSSQTQWTINQIGRPGTTYGATAPDSPKVGDIWFKYLADGGTEIYRWNGDIWELLASPTTADDIAAAVDDAVSQAKDYSDKAIADNQTKIDESIKSVDDKANQLKQDQSALDIKAQDYAKQAKTDAIANTAQAVKEIADNSQKALDQAKTDLTNGITKETADRQSAVNALDTKAQGYANQAKSDALNTIAKEATDRQNAVSALDTKATNAINQAKSDINDTIKALSVGGRNLYLNSKVMADGYGINENVRATVEPFDSTTNMWHIVAAQGQGDYTGIWLPNYGAGKLPDNSDWSYSADIKGTGKVVQFGIEAGDKIPVKGNIGSTWSRISQTGHINEGPKTIIMYFDTTDSPLDVYIKLPKFEEGNVPTDWTPAPEDVVLDYTTKDNQIKETITQYQETNDGKVSKVQTEVSTALGQVATKVSQTDYDKKTGDLSTKYTEVKQTADSQAADIVDIKKTATSQASKINSISSDVDGTKQSISDIKTTQDSHSDKINQITTDVDGTKQSITDIQTKDDKQDTRMGTIETSVSGVKSDFSSYKTTNDGVVKTAQTTAQTAVDGLKNKVSQTDYNTKTGQLQTDLTTTTQTANQATTDIASIKQKDGDQDARMTKIESDASGVKTTVSDLKTAQGKQSGSISTLQQRADGFDATVTKVDSLAVGGRNILLNSKVLSWDVGNNTATTSTKVSYDSTTNTWHITSPKGGSGSCGIYFGMAAISSRSIANGEKWAFSLDVKGTGDHSQFGIEGSTSFNKYTGSVSSDWTRVSSTGVSNGSNIIIIYFSSMNTAVDVYVKLPKLETGNVPTDYTPAPEDLSGAIAKAQLTADQATLSINNYKTDADGRISKAQADIITNANAITQKVSQTDYNAKTGDLSTKVSTAQQTADQANTTIGNYQNSNDGRVASAESAIKQNATNIASKVSQSDYNAKTGQIDSQISTIDQNAKAITQTVTQVSDKVDNLQVGGRNYIINSDISSGTTLTDKFFTSVGTSAFSNQMLTLSVQVDYDNITNLAGNKRLGFLTFLTNTDGNNIWFGAVKNPNIGDSFHGRVSVTTDLTNINTLNMNSNRLPWGILIEGVEGSNVSVSRPKLEIGNKATDWTPAPEDTDSKFSQQQQTIDSINSTVQQQGTNINKVSTRVQTAEGNISTVQNNINGLQSSQKQTADGLSQEVSDRKSGDNTVLQQGKDFITSQVSNSESNMRSLINQKADSATIGVINEDVRSLKSQVNWQEMAWDDVDYLKENGNYLITSGTGANSPFKPWFYIIVDAPRTDRITQTVWKDSNSNITYKRSLFETTWSAWHQVVSSETLLSIFHDSWSLGTSTNDGITKQMVTGIMGQPDGTLILKGNSLILDGNTTVTGDFYAKGGNFTNLNASNLTVGTLNGNQVNITNINANNIVSGAISGANLNINLNTGKVVFQNGRIYNEGVQTGGAGIDVNIDQRYIATSDGYSSSVLKNGMMMLYQSTLVNSGKDPYFKIDNFGTQLTLEGARLRGSKNISIGVYSSSDVLVFGGHSELNGAVFSDGYAARIEGKDKGVKVSGGAAFGSISPASPNILVGVDSLRSGFGGDRIAVNAKYFYLLNQYATTTSSGANMFLTDDGAVIRSSSSSKYKLNINYEQSSETANKLLTIDPALWHDKFESEQLDKFHDIGIEPERTIDMDKRWYYGIIAEDLVKAGLEHLVMRDTKTGEVEGVEYSKIGVALIPIIRELRNRLNEQYVEIERLKEQSK
ncbi:phage tail spike protein [Leuconostoc citreum]|uniref:phage tail spike protein n=1 Tax=Leuconostoc citreum TaxID=33964 RepID=UPI0020731A73|nr:phage tail spike protein [Leuconostoc citreum]